MIDSARSSVRQLWPLLAVRDINCRLERGGSSIMLQQFREEDGETWGRGVCFYFICVDADAMYAELAAVGLQLEAPRVACYGMKQLFVPEPDGYAICFESPTEDWKGQGRPPRGEGR